MHDQHLPGLRRHRAQRGHGRRTKPSRRSASPTWKVASRGEPSPRGPGPMPTTMNAGRFAAETPRAAGLAFMSLAVMTDGGLHAEPHRRRQRDTRGEPVDVGLAKLAAVEYHDSGDYMSDLRAPPRRPMTGFGKGRPSVAPSLGARRRRHGTDDWPVILANEFGGFPAGTYLLPEDHAVGMPGTSGQMRARADPAGFSDSAFARRDGLFSSVDRRANVPRRSAISGLRATPDPGKRSSRRTVRNRFTGGFQTRTRQKIAAMGYAIIANMGGQMSDLDGGFSERPSSSGPVLLRP